MKRSLSLLALLVAASFGVAACGDDDETTTGAAEPALSGAEYLAQASEICRTRIRELNRATRAAFGGGGGPPSDAEIQEFGTEAVIPGIQGLIDESRALRPPEDRADEFERFLDDAQAALDQVKADPSLLAQEQDPFKSIEKQARELGLKCG
jgi:predicted small secreted protein